MAICVGALSRVFFQICRISCASTARQGLLCSSEPSIRWTQQFQAYSEDIPAKPKRPITSFFQFAAEQRPKVMEAEPGLSNPDIVKKVAALWKELPDSEKEVYRSEFETRMGRFYEEMEEFKSRLTDEQLNMLLERSRQKRKMKLKRRQRVEMKKLNKPKRPPSGYSLFVRAHLNSTFRPGGVRTAEERQGLFKEAAEAWKSLPEYEKQQYNEEASRLFESYREEMDEWKRKMEEEGHKI